jgi:PKD repeat protein
MSHEHNESITDPIPNDTWTNGAGANHGEELGDQCDGHMGTTLGTHNGASYNQVINGHFYWYQEEWSNDGHTCLQRYTPPTTLPHATYTATAGSGLAMTFNASASTAPSGIADFSWQFNAVTNQATFEQTTPSITYTFPATGAYSTGLTVFAKTSGLSIGAGGIITTGHSGFVSGLSVSPTSPAAGQTVTFTGLSKLSQKPVSNWLWEFGDGTTGSGQKPTHTYAAAGKYKVEVIEFSGVGSAFPGSGAAPIAYRFVTVS